MTPESISYLTLIVSTLFGIINIVWTWWRQSIVTREIEVFKTDQQKTLEEFKADLVRRTEILKSALAVGPNERDAISRIRMALPGVRPTFERLTASIGHFDDDENGSFVFFDTTSYESDLEAFLGSIIGVSIDMLSPIRDSIQKEIRNVRSGFRDDDPDGETERIELVHSSVTEINFQLDLLRSLLEERTVQLDRSIHLGLSDPILREVAITGEAIA